jgi:hypothetical protein
VLVATEPGITSGVRAMHFFSAPVEIAGETRQVVVSVREAHDGRSHYDLTFGAEVRT